MQLKKNSVARFVFCTQAVKIGRLPVPLGELVHSVGVAFQSLVCVMAFETVLEAPMR